MLGERLKKLRKYHGFTANRIAKALNISERAYRFYEAGSRNPPFDILVKLSEIYDTSIDYLVTGSDWRGSLSVFSDED